MGEGGVGDGKRYAVEGDGVKPVGNLNAVPVCGGSVFDGCAECRVTQGDSPVRVCTLFGDIRNMDGPNDRETEA